MPNAPALRGARRTALLAGRQLRTTRGRGSNSALVFPCLSQVLRSWQPLFSAQRERKRHRIKGNLHAPRVKQQCTNISKRKTERRAESGAAAAEGQAFPLRLPTSSGGHAGGLTGGPSSGPSPVTGVGVGVGVGRTGRSKLSGECRRKASETRGNFRARWSTGEREAFGTSTVMRRLRDRDVRSARSFWVPVRLHWSP